jgi:hypothetical protein
VQIKEEAIVVAYAQTYLEAQRRKYLIEIEGTIFKHHHLNNLS